jgi:dihydroorotate dehydrogenase (fumarate)/dihydropyrimidine dehydrogenase (NAD+) subunit PreA
MDEHGYEDIPSMYGIASRKAVRDYAEQFARNRVHAVVNQDTCKNPTCTVCIQMCFYEALSQSPESRIEVHADNCIGCELCMDVCPFESIAMKPTAAGHYAQGYFRIPDGVYESTGKFDTERNHPSRIGRKAIGRMKSAAE